MLPSQQRNYQQPPRTLSNRTLFKSRARVPFLDTAMGRFGLLTGLVLAFGSGMLLQRPVHAPTFTLNQKLSQVMQVPALVRAPVATVLPGQKTIVPDSAVLSVASAKAPVVKTPVAKTMPAPVVAAPITAPVVTTPAPDTITLQRNLVVVEVPKGASLGNTLSKNTPAVRQSVLQAFADNSDILKSAQRFEYASGVPVNVNNKTVRATRVFYVAVLANGQWHKRYNLGAEGWFNERGERFVQSPLGMPVANARMTSGFGTRNHPVLGGRRMHTGIDYAAPIGSPVYAVHNGTITFMGGKTGYGNYLQVKHDDTYTTAYAHLRGFAKGLRDGSTVRKGTVIGYVGMTGYTTGPHLHYEVLRDGDFINPLNWTSVATVEAAKNKMMLAQAQATVQSLKKQPNQNLQYANLTAVPTF